MSLVKRRLVAVAATWAVATGAAYAATLHTDDFSASLSGWTSGGAIVSHEAGGGPDGEGDGWMHVQSGTNHLATHNSLSAWTGNFAGLGAATVTADLMVPASSEPLNIRLVLFGPGTSPMTSSRWTSTVAAPVPADGVWRSYEFSLADEDLTQVVTVPGDTYDDLMTNVLRVMFRHDAGTPSSGGTSTSGSFGVDNITLAAADDPVLHGDYNENGRVDAADYTLWRDHLGAPAGTLPNDVDGGTIGVEQYNTWKTAFGDIGSSSVGTAPVPEPSAVGLAVAATAYFLFFRRPDDEKAFHDFDSRRLHANGRRRSARAVLLGRL